MEEVLPTIRKTDDGYMTALEAQELLVNPVLIIGLGNQAKEISNTLNWGIRIPGVNRGMNAITEFNFDGNNVRTVEKDGEHLFVAKDICAVLEVKNSRDALKHLDDDEKYEVVLNDSMGREQKASAVNESGMYALVMRSRKPQAKAFRKWVTAEVLPTIHKTSFTKNTLPEQFHLPLFELFL